ncbi:unnamed protein product [Rotaria sp. Silwood2]|nr:unnamed protein product [Rotaria sp. Silwood2]CAF3207984.1 unnamed protein product [Rotaria sp. Silwood2]CAF4382736.1 unnamed protein product [Rotaria sp. Silwood2]CAF4488858.1 unnamed protein product [Rotaria sp. Silwood2]
MLMMYFAIFTLLLATRISSVPSPSIVYSAVIYNARVSPVRCDVFRSLPSGRTVKFGPFTIRKHERYLIKELTFNMGTWKADAIIEKIQCGNLVLTAPFAHVISPVKNWKFVVQQHKIVSVGPS